jgi:hypothetical protein
MTLEAQATAFRDRNKLCDDIKNFVKGSGIGAKQRIVTPEHKNYRMGIYRRYQYRISRLAPYTSLMYMHSYIYIHRYT